MKFNRTYLVLSIFACLTLTVALGISLVGYFRAVERGVSGSGSEKHLLAQLRAFHEQMKRADSPDDANVAVRLMETITGFGPGSEVLLEIKKAYAPALATFAGKPREAETHFQLAKKRELMETLVNSYRKEVLHGDLRVRAAYLNLLFDTQSSLLNESEEAEQVYLKRNRERLDSLKSTVVGAPDAGLPVRVAAIDAIFQAYDRGFGLSQKWRAEKAEALAKADKALSTIAKGAFSGDDAGADETRRAFLSICFLSLVLGTLSFVALYIGFKLLRIRAEVKAEAFFAYLRSFGSERADATMAGTVQALRADREWAPVLNEVQRAEEGFLRSCQNQLAISRALRVPYVLIGKDRGVRFWNEPASSLFGLKEGKEWGLDDLLRPERAKLKNSSTETALDAVRAALAGQGEERFDLLVSGPEGWTPYELSLNPITAGALTGGRILLWREVREEAARFDKAVSTQVERLRDLVHRVTHQYETDFALRESDAPSARAMISDLALLKDQLKEREHLWRSEAQALGDQITRQQDVLNRLGEELARVRREQAEALTLVREVHGEEEHLHDEVCVMERDLERWASGRRRLIKDLELQTATLDRARLFEEQLRAANEGILRELERYDVGLGELRQLAESARLHSVNLSLVRDPGYWEYATRARAFAQDLMQFVAGAEALGQKMRAFLDSHPGGALAAHLGGGAIDGELLTALSDEQTRLGTTLRRWRESGQLVVKGGEKAVALLQESEKGSAVLTQLSETSLLINQQAKGNLERWN